MNKLFVGISCLPFTALNPNFESHFHAEDSIYDTASSGYNTIPTEQLASGLGNQSLIEQQKNAVRSVGGTYS